MNESGEAAMNLSVWVADAWHVPGDYSSRLGSRTEASSEGGREVGGWGEVSEWAILQQDCLPGDRL